MILEYHIVSECEQNLLDVELEVRNKLSVDLYSEAPFACYNSIDLTKSQVAHLIDQLIVFHQGMED